jgi:hypothetical protein
VKYSYNRFTLLWHQRSICFMVLGGGGGIDAPEVQVKRITRNLACSIFCRHFRLQPADRTQSLKCSVTVRNDFRLIRIYDMKAVVCGLRTMSSVLLTTGYGLSSSSCAKIRSMSNSKR